MKYVSKSVPKVTVKWDIDGLEEIVKISKIELEDRNTPTQVILLDENEQGSSAEASKTHCLLNEIKGNSNEVIEFCIQQDKKRKHTQSNSSSNESSQTNATPSESAITTSDTTILLFETSYTDTLLHSYTPKRLLPNLTSITVNQFNVEREKKERNCVYKHF